MTIPDSTPIQDVVQVLNLDTDEGEAVLSLSGVRTLGDLRVVIERGEVEKALAAKLKKALG